MVAATVSFAPRSGSMCSNCLDLKYAHHCRYKGSRSQVPLLPRPENEENQSNSICTREDIDIQNFVRYPFVDTEFLSSLPPEDIAFLTSKNSHTLPDDDAIDEFVRQYFKRMHPIVPVVDEAQFWRIYQGDTGVGKLSLFLLQAILFASCVVSHTFQGMYLLSILLTL